MSGTVLKDLLKKVWGYEQFRPLQEEIALSVLEGRDTLALLPTGGGKSLCFQLPALAMEGICLVVTPLIALMKDQVMHLQERGIAAMAIHSGMSGREVDILLDNCAYGKVKFLYVSPERLRTELFLARLEKMQVGLLAVDEAHCISTWGHDFRPAYLEIAQVRALIPDVPVIALTASATPEVQKDIQAQLDFRSPRVFMKSFARPNLSYAVREVEDGQQKLLDVLRRIGGSAVVYVKTRKQAKVQAAFLYSHGISADYYHAGLDNELRSSKQDRWVKDEVRVMVATNAFGMGIDKADVRLVAHMGTPGSLEAYYQEAGRAGRDGKRAYALAIIGRGDLSDMEALHLMTHPEVDYLKRVYQCLANYYKMAVGSGAGTQHDFHLHGFCDTYNLDYREAYYALKKLEEENLITFNESYYNPSKIFIGIPPARLYEFQVANAVLDVFIKGLLRIYGGEVFTNFVRISEGHIAKQMGLKEAEVAQRLKTLAHQKVLLYEPAKDSPQLTFIMARQSPAHLPLDRRRLKERERTDRKKLDAVKHYVQQDSQCRSLVIQEYFGEKGGESCGVCDYCLEKKKKGGRKLFRRYEELILHSLRQGPMTTEVLMEVLMPEDKEAFLECVRQMLEAEVLHYDSQWRLSEVGR